MFALVKSAKKQKYNVKCKKGTKVKNNPAF